MKIRDFPHGATKLKPESRKSCRHCVAAMLQEGTTLQALRTRSSNPPMMLGHGNQESLLCRVMKQLHGPENTASSARTRGCNTCAGSLLFTSYAMQSLDQEHKGAANGNDCIVGRAESKLAPTEPGL